MLPGGPPPRQRSVEDLLSRLLDIRARKEALARKEAKEGIAELDRAEEETAALLKGKVQLLQDRLLRAGAFCPPLGWVRDSHGPRIPTEHVVWKKGDTWASVSKRHLGSGRYAEALKHFSEGYSVESLDPADTARYVVITKAWVLEKYYGLLIPNP